MEVLAREHPAVVFILGDVIREHREWGTYRKLYSELEKIGSDFQVIPGNHNRPVHVDIAKKWKGRNVTLHNDDAIVIVSRNGTRDVVLGHDLRNNASVHGERKV
jgi:metallophosphoesterase superfamily enzyme